VGTARCLFTVGPWAGVVHAKHGMNGSCSSCFD
jgi:hypothetical protein